MIDTDKYEGHTPAPWKWIIDDKDTYLSCFDNDIKADENLIADAPLLLAEVKRLREVNDDLICDLEGFQEAVKEDEAGYKDLVASLEGIEEELKAEVKRLREGIKEVIDVLYEWDNGKYVGMIIGLSDLIE